MYPPGTGGCFAYPVTPGFLISCPAPEGREPLPSTHAHTCLLRSHAAIHSVPMVSGLQLCPGARHGVGHMTYTKEIFVG